MSRHFLEISYKGTRYNGWQIQDNAISVQEKIQAALSTILRKKIKITGASRTDTGVHARQTFAHFDIEKPLPEDLQYRANRILPADIALKKIYPVPPDTHARFDALSRSYEYIIYFEKNPFLVDFGYYYTFGKLNVEAMQQAADLLLNYKDFYCFGKAGMQVKTTFCTIKKAKWHWQEKDKTLTFSITADRFLRGMVRGIVGTLIRIGEGKLELSNFKKIIENKQREKVDFSVPPQGLYLTKIKYP